MCPGELLATNRLILLTANMVKRFQLVPADDARNMSCDARDYMFVMAMDAPSFQMRAIARNVTEPQEKD